MKKTGRVYKRMIITYVLVLCIPILLSAVLYQFTYRTVREQSLENNSNLLNRVSNSCDRDISYYRNVLIQLKLDEDVNSYLFSRVINTNQKLMLAHDILEDMSTISVSMRDLGAYCQDFFIYSPKEDDVLSVTGKANYDIYSKAIMAMNPEQSVHLKDTVLALEKQDIIRIETKAGEYIVLLEPVQSKSRADRAVVGLWIKPEIFKEHIGYADEHLDIEWAFVDGEGEFLFRTEGLCASSMTAEELYEQKDQEVRVQNERYLVHIVDAEMYGARYFLLTPVTSIIQTANNIRNVHLLCMLVSVLLGYFAVKLAVKRNYSSLERVLSILPAKGDGKGAQDEFQYLENRVSDLLSQYGDTHEDMRENKRAVQGLAFERLLLPQGKKEREDVAYSKELYAKFKSGVNVVLVFSIRGSIPIENGEMAPVMENSLKRFVLANVLAEGIGEKYTQETKEYDEQVVMIVNFPEGEENAVDTLQSLCDKYCGFVEDNFKFRINTFAGTGYKGIEGIHYSYLEACQAENFGMDSDENFVSYNEIDAYTTRKYQYSFETEETVINAIRNGNVNLANSLIDNVLEKHFYDKDRTLWQCMLYDIYTSLIKVSEEMEISINRIPLINQAFSKDTLQELKEWFHEIVNGTFNKEPETVDEEEYKGQEFYEGVLEFIRANFKDPDLNISQIAVEFRMTPTYVSAVFKKQTGKSILDVIRQMRIEYAKDLLESDMSVEEVAFAAGFRESSTFIRAFKNYHGITPGQMKKLI